MRAVVFHGIGKVRLEDREIPALPADGVLLRVLVAGICMTDMHIVQGHFPVPPPRVLGHELSGVVEAVGEKVDPAWLGQAVGVRPARFCGDCWPCRHGRAHLCANFQCLGNTQDGGFAEYAAVGADQLEQLGGQSPDRAVWLEPLACVLHAIAVADPPPGGTILICGAGTLGALAVRALRLTYEVRVGVLDPNRAKIERALRSGAEAGWVVQRQSSAEEIGRAVTAWAGESLSAIIETSGKSAALERAVDWSTPGTRIVLFGVADPGARAGLSMAAMLGKEIDLTAASGMTVETFVAASRLLADDRLDTEGLVEGVIGLDAVPEVLEGMTRQSGGKVLIRP